MASASQIALSHDADAHMIRGEGQRLNGQGEAAMPRRRFQQGGLFLRGKDPQKWIGRLREDVVRLDGSVHRVRKSIVLGIKSKDDLPTEKLARRKLDLYLRRVNAEDYRPSRIST